MVYHLPKTLYPILLVANRKNLLTLYNPNVAMIGTIATFVLSLIFKVCDQCFLSIARQA